jgi:3-deoxy-manno-octulosonate cytidylyltransferase (CMP-KDO synthetase)
MKVLGIIPARYASTRFPAKPLVDIGGKTMIQRVYEQAKKATSLDHVIVATDDQRIFDHVKSIGGEVMMTSENHLSGTDRCAEVATAINFAIQERNFDDNLMDKMGKKLEAGYSIVVNIQGDEPFIQPEQIDGLVSFFKQNWDFQVVTLAKRFEQKADLKNPNLVKVVFTEGGRALYFSRSIIPNVAQIEQEKWLNTGAFYRHIGLYAYKVSVLNELAALKPSRLEQLEKLEQLRWLENNITIGVAETELETVGIDTPEDLKRLIF